MKLKLKLSLAKIDVIKMEVIKIEVIKIEVTKVEVIKIEVINIEECGGCLVPLILEAKMDTITPPASCKTAFIPCITLFDV